MSQASSGVRQGFSVPCVANGWAGRLTDTCESSVCLAFRNSDMLVRAVLLLFCVHAAVGVQPRGRLGEEART